MNLSANSSSVNIAVSKSDSEDAKATVVVCVLGQESGGQPRTLARQMCSEMSAEHLLES